MYYDCIDNAMEVTLPSFGSTSIVRIASGEDFSTSRTSIRQIREGDYHIAHQVYILNVHLSAGPQSCGEVLRALGKKPYVRP